MSKPEPRILSWDLETTNLKANYGYVLSAAYKPWKKKARVISITDFPSFKKDPTNDKQLVKQFAKEISDADMWVTHFGSNGLFDVPFLNTRLLYHNLPPLPNVPHIDTWRVARNNLKLNSNRLATIGEFYGLSNKTPVLGGAWLKAMAGHKPSIKYVVDHNIKDVILLEQVYEKLRPLIKNHPNLNIIRESGICPVCGFEKVQKRGWTVAGVSRRRRYFCTACNAWSKGPPERVKRIIVR